MIQFPANTQNPRFLTLGSQEHRDYVKLLEYLKDPKAHLQAAKLEPRMCLSCWVIFSSTQEAEQHPHQMSGAVSAGSNLKRPEKHKITGTFSTMVVANERSLFDLAKAYGKVSSDMRAMIPLELTPCLAEALKTHAYFSSKTGEPVQLITPAKTDVSEELGDPQTINGKRTALQKSNDSP
jgi:hypothetical protein